jgi:hypothetical protein
LLDELDPPIADTSYVAATPVPGFVRCEDPNCTIAAATLPVGRVFEHYHEKPKKCPFDGFDHGLMPEEPCPVCGDLGTVNTESTGNCVTAKDKEAPKPGRGKVIRLKHITRDMVRADRNTVYVFGDNMARRGYGGQAKEMRGESNAIGVPTKWRPERSEAAYFTDAAFQQLNVRSELQYAFDRMEEVLASGRNVVIPADGLGTGLAELPRRAPHINRYIEERIAKLEALPCQ